MNLIEKVKVILKEGYTVVDAKFLHELCQAVVEAEMLISHALHLGYLGEGSTKGMADEWISRYAGEEKGTMVSCVNCAMPIPLSEKTFCKDCAKYFPEKKESGE